MLAYDWDHHLVTENGAFDWRSYMVEGIDDKETKWSGQRRRGCQGWPCPWIIDPGMAIHGQCSGILSPSLLACALLAWALVDRGVPSRYLCTSSQAPEFETYHFEYIQPH